MSKHVAVRIDHKEARIFSLHPESTDEATIMAPLHNVHHEHPTGPEGTKEHHPTDKRFVAYAKKYFTRSDRMR